MRSAAVALTGTLTGEQRDLAVLPFADDAARRWLEYRPRLRPGACLAGLSVAARKAAHRLLSTALSHRAYAQAMAVIALEEVLDRPKRAGSARPAQRRLLGGRVRRPGGRRPVVVAARGAPPVGDHDRGGRRGLPGAGVPRRQPGPGRATPAGRCPGRSAPRRTWPATCWTRSGPAAGPGDRGREAPGGHPQRHPPARRRAARAAGVAGAASWDRPPRAARQLAALYLDRLPPAWPREADRTPPAGCTSPGRGPRPGQRHYYRIQGDDLLIEYDNTSSDGNHAHTVLRRPRSDFGDDVLAAHYQRSYH